MRRITLQTGRTLAIVIAGLLAGGTALADKPSWAGGGKNEKQERGGQDRPGADRKPERHEKVAPGEGVFFGDKHRTAANGYYADRFRAGRCPPGLAKKNNGCLPPGQAKKWSVGRPLPRDVIYYDLPPALFMQFGPPPPRHRYVRVAADILLIAIGTGIVVDAIQDLGNM